MNVTLFYIRFNEVANVQTNLARFHHQEFDGLLLLPRRRGCFANLFFSCTFVIKKQTDPWKFKIATQRRLPYEKSYKSATKQNRKYDKRFKERKQVKLLLHAKYQKVQKNQTMKLTRALCLPPCIGLTEPARKTRKFFKRWPEPIIMPVGCVFKSCFSAGTI